MAIAKPIGFDNWRLFYFSTNDGSGRTLKQKGSFVHADVANYSLYRGPSIVATSSASEVVITTAEPHGFRVQEKIRIHGMPDELAGLNEEWFVLATPTTTTFTVGFDSSALGATADYGIAGIDVGSRWSLAGHDLIVGRNCTDEYPDAWELPLEG